ncbi:MAG TPA: hypothetical protein VGZ02_11475 [Candidatus Baltobacteraceae bacterium]|jgi:hypothetical protein|nr:hypothetical protein [Candidatus Baltobacteraceae bacterium]
MNEAVGSLAEWVGGIATAASVVAAIVIFRRTADDARIQNGLSWRPHLAFDHPVIENTASGVWSIKATNIGRGPAIQCRYVGYVDGAFYRAHAFAVGAENELKTPRCAVRLEAADAAALRFCHSALDDLIKPGETQRLEVFLCSDIVGNRWRFVRGLPYPDGPQPDNDGARARWADNWPTGKGPAGTWSGRARDAEKTRGVV